MLDLSRVGGLILPLRAWLLIEMMYTGYSRFNSAPVERIWCPVWGGHRPPAEKAVWISFYVAAVVKPLFPCFPSLASLSL